MHEVDFWQNVDLRIEEMVKMWTCHTQMQTRHGKMVMTTLKELNNLTKIILATIVKTKKLKEPVQEGSNGKRRTTIN